MARSHESMWLTLAATSGACATALAGIAVTLHVMPYAHFSVWTSWPMISCYVVAALTLIGFTAAARQWRFPGAIDRPHTHRINASLASAKAVSPPAGSLALVVPRELPAGVGHFVGRADELAALTQLLESANGQAAGTVVISAIGGTAGVGKTALAVHWAHQVADGFPDGQLYVNLRGYDPGQPVTAADALARFLRALGVPRQDIPAEEDERAALYRSLLNGRRMLVLVDNAKSVEQVRPLLPSSSTCVAMVTSRDSLTGLVALDGANRLDLGLLPLDQAISLLRALIGPRVDADPRAATVLAEQCCRLPLALRVAAELAAARPGIPLADLASELADQRQRLELLDTTGDTRTMVRAVFSWSYRHLDIGTARAFRLMGLHPGPDCDSYAVAALIHTTPEQAARVLSVLAQAHLIHPAGRDRFGMHDLLRAYARHLALTHDSEEDRQAALARLLDYYLHSTAAAMDTLFPAERRRRPPIHPPAAPAPDPALARPLTAGAWLDAERASLVATAAHAADHGSPFHTTGLAATLCRYLDAGGHYSEALSIHDHARRAACQSGDRVAEATALRDLGVVNSHLGRCQQGTAHFQQALALFREAGDLPGEARVLNNLGVGDFCLARWPQAADHFRQALALYRGTGDRPGEARALNNLGVIEGRQGHCDRAVRYLEQSLALCRQIDDRRGEAEALTALGVIERCQGRYRQAVRYQEQSLALCRQISDRRGEAEALTALGVTEARQGRYEQSVCHQEQSLALCREMSDRFGEAEALNGLGEVLSLTGRPGLARIQHTAALSHANQIGDRYELARAHDGLAQSYLATPDSRQAQHHRLQALAAYIEIGAPEADQVRAQLTAIASYRR